MKKEIVEKINTLSDIKYTTELKAERSEIARIKSEEEKNQTKIVNENRAKTMSAIDYSPQQNKHETQKKLTDERFKRLQSYLKGDI